MVEFKCNWECGNECVNCGDYNSTMNEDGKWECVNCGGLNFVEVHRQGCINENIEEED